MGPAPSDPSKDSQFNHWEIPVQNWWAQNKEKYKIITPADKPTRVDNIHTEISKPVVSILEPNEKTVYLKDQRIQLRVANSGYFPPQKMDIFINDTFIDTIRAPFVFSFVPSEIDNIQTENKLRLISYDSVYSRTENTLTFSVNL